MKKAQAVALGVPGHEVDAAQRAGFNLAWLLTIGRGLMNLAVKYPQAIGPIKDFVAAVNSGDAAAMLRAVQALLTIFAAAGEAAQAGGGVSPA